MTRTLTATTLTVLLIGALVAGAAPAAAEHDGGDDGFLPDGTAAVDIASQVLSNPGAAISGLTARFDGEADRSATAAEEDVRTYFNNRSAAFESYGATHPLTGAESRDVVRIVYEVDGETASHVAVANVSDGEYRDPKIVTSTSRSVDYECTLEGAAAKNAPDELATFYEDYVQPGETNTSGWETRMATQYGGNVACEEVV
jgi:hypothetical protein